MAATDPRIYFLLARGSARAVVFRRGPTAHVLQLAWDRSTDTFEEGQWLKAKVFERRCDLSPSGLLLVYCAQDYRRSPPVWTAISRPPWFTALACWGQDHSWGGGGLFDSERSLMLNRGRLGANLISQPVPKRLDVRIQYGGGEDQPLLGHRELRDGWIRQDVGKVRRTHVGEARVNYDPPIVHHRHSGEWTLVRELRGRFHRERGSYVEHFRLDGPRTIDLGRLDHADWDDRGKKPTLVFARGGRIWRWPRPFEGEPTELIDLRDRTFESRQAPAQATRW